MESLKADAEANAFAMELLMPRDMIARAIEKMRGMKADTVVTRMAGTFQVEPGTMRARLIQLGYMMG